MKCVHFGTGILMLLLCHIYLHHCHCATILFEDSIAKRHLCQNYPYTYTLLNSVWIVDLFFIQPQCHWYTRSTLCLNRCNLFVIMFLKRL